MEQQFLINMSSDEFFSRLKECFAEAMFAPESNEGVKVKKHYVYGLQGICDLLGCSTATAARITHKAKWCDRRGNQPNR